ncbi:MAG: transposase [Actinomycetia bacterium]|nr:transposase [Actinomycetes bacterium]
MSRAGVRVGVGTRFRSDGETVEVIEVAITAAGNEVVLKDHHGRLMRLAVRELLLSDRAWVIPDSPGPSSDDDEEIASVAREVLTGYRSGSPEIAEEGEPRPQYAPGGPLYERYAAKAAELDVTRRTIQPWVQGFQRRGVAGLVGEDQLPQRKDAKVDDRWTETALEVMGGYKDESRPSRTWVIEQTRARVIARFGPDAVIQPSNLGFCQPTAVRRISYQDSLIFEQVHRDSYRAFGYELIDIPAAPAPRRSHHQGHLASVTGRWPGRGGRLRCMPMIGDGNPWTDRSLLRGDQYRTDANLAARQSLYHWQHPRLDLPALVADIAGLDGSERVTDVGNGAYLAEFARRGHGGPVLGVDLSPGMLHAAHDRGPAAALAAGDAAAPLRDAVSDVTDGYALPVTVRGEAIAAVWRYPVTLGRLSWGSACVRGSQTMPMSFGWIWGQEE